MNKSISIPEFAAEAFDLIDFIQTALQRRSPKPRSARREVESRDSDRHTVPVSWTDCSWSVSILGQPPISPTQEVEALPGSSVDER